MVASYGSYSHQATTHSLLPSVGKSSQRHYEGLKHVVIIRDKQSGLGERGKVENRSSLGLRVLQVAVLQYIILEPSTVSALASEERYSTYY